MLLQKLAIVSLLAGIVASQDVSNDDIPQQCRAVCAEVVTISRRCDDQTDNDRAELECICRAPNANTLVPTCEACVAQFDTDTDNDDNDRNDNDVFEVLTRCNFTTTAYNSQSASNILQSLASSFASAPGSVVRTTSGTVVFTTSVAAGATGAPVQSTAGAPVQTAAAGAAMGLVGLAMGLL